MQPVSLNRLISVRGYHHTYGLKKTISFRETASQDGTFLAEFV